MVIYDIKRKLDLVWELNDLEDRDLLDDTSLNIARELIESLKRDVAKEALSEGVE